MEITQSKQAREVHLLNRSNALKNIYCFIALWHAHAYCEGKLERLCMQISILVSEFGPHRVSCPACAEAMRLVGIESHPNIPDMVDLVTYECACGKVIAEPRLAELAIEAPVS
jgi:hypothetical protein